MKPDRDVVSSDQLHRVVHSFAVDKEGGTCYHALLKTFNNPIIPWAAVSKIVSIDNKIFVRTGFFDRFRKQELDFDEEMKKAPSSFKDRFKGLKKRSGIQTVKGYKPAEDVEQKIQAITMEVFGNQGDWRSNSLEDRTQKFKFLTKCQKDLDHQITNMDLNSMNKVDDVIKYFMTEVKDSCAYEDISKLDLPKNLNINLEYSNVVSPNDPEPEEKDYAQEVRDPKYKRKYKYHYNKELEVHQC